jgi:YidC/Oxa1 family membrane protein insertase
MHESLHLGYGWVLIAFGLLVRLLLWPLNQKAMRANTALQALQPQLQRIQEQYKADRRPCRRRCSSSTRRTGSTRWAAAGPCSCRCRCCSRCSSCWELDRAAGRAVPLVPRPRAAGPVLHHPDPERHLDVRADEGRADGIQHTAQTKMQAQMMTYMMPVMITIFGFNFASGLNLYWTVSNLASIPQQWLIARERMKLQKAEVKAFVEIKTKPD